MTQSAALRYFDVHSRKISRLPAARVDAGGLSHGLSAVENLAIGGERCGVLFFASDVDATGNGLIQRVSKALSLAMTELYGRLA